MSLDEMIGTETPLDRAQFTRAAELIRELGFWNGSDDNGKICVGLALLQAKQERPSGPWNGEPAVYYAEMKHLAEQLGFTGRLNGELVDFIYAWNDSTPEGEVLDVLDRLGRGETLV